MKLDVGKYVKVERECSTGKTKVYKHMVGMHGTVTGMYGDGDEQEVSVRVNEISIPPAVAMRNSMFVENLRKQAGIKNGEPFHPAYSILAPVNCISVIKPIPEGKLTTRTLKEWAREVGVPIVEVDYPVSSAVGIDYDGKHYSKAKIVGGNVEVHSDVLLSVAAEMIEREISDVLIVLCEWKTGGGTMTRGLVFTNGEPIIEKMPEPAPVAPEDESIDNEPVEIDVQCDVGLQIDEIEITLDEEFVNFELPDFGEEE